MYDSNRFARTSTIKFAPEPRRQRAPLIGDVARPTISPIAKAENLTHAPDGAELAQWASVRQS